MLRSLSIRNIVLVQALDLDFDRGLSVLTGETGAGKSILLDALGLALGRKGRRDLASKGSDGGSVTAVFEPDPDAAIHTRLAELGLASVDGDIILRRTTTPDGRSRAFVNDNRVSAKVLEEIGAALVEIHGQHDDTGLLNRRAHRTLLDGFAGTVDLLEQTGSAWVEWQEAEKALAEAIAAHEQAAVDADYLRHSVDELEALAPHTEEDADLDAERRLVRQSASLLDEMARARDALSTKGAEQALGDALSRLTHAAERAEGRLEPVIGAIDRTLCELMEAQAHLSDAMESLTFDPNRLEDIEERLFEIRRIARKHDVHPDALAEETNRLRARLDAIEGHEDRMAELRSTVAAGKARYDEAATRLSEARRAAARTLDTVVTAELPPLRMENAVFLTEIVDTAPGPAGTDSVRFTAQINPGAPSGPIDEIASGGELSRFLLALRVQLAGSSQSDTIIFDEIDRGVGGATANAVGERLGGLGRTTQVIAVTHSPQVSAKANHHFHIVKSVEGTSARTDVIALTDDARVTEIARMLAGETITEEARSAARALIATTTQTEDR